MGYTIWPDGPDGDTIREVYEELQRARRKFGDFKNGREGHSVVEEEFEEFWEEVKADNLIKAKKEAIQLAAMAIRFIVDVKKCNSDVVG